MHQKIKVLILINELLRGGAQRIVLDIAKNIDREKYDLQIAYLKSHTNFDKNSKTVLDEVKATGVRVTCLEGKKKFSLAEAWRLFTFLRTERPHVLHVVLPYAGVMGRVIGRLAGVKKIVSLQCNLPVAYGRRIYWLDKLTLPLGTAWTGATEGIELSYGKSVTPYSEQAYKEGKRHFTIVAGVDLPAFDAKINNINKESKKQELNIISTQKIIMMTARLISWKGHADLVEAMKYLPETTELVLVGWGPLEAELKTQAKNLGIEQRVHFLGARNDVIELLKMTDVYVQAHSYAPDGKIWMGPNTSQMEACAAFIPSVSTAVPLIEYLIEEGITGKLATPNDPHDLARAISYILDHSEDAKIYSKNARKRIEERYSVHAMIQKYESLYALITT